MTVGHRSEASEYDALPYTDHAYAETHPDRLAVVARLSKWEAPAIERARVLEIGCARGGNLLPMAASMPDATLVGVDPAASQIEEARRIAREAALANVRFEATTAEGLDGDHAPFDFVIAHGVWSWVAIDARRAMLRSIASRLAPSGIAYVSFNALPGWYAKMAARDFARFASRAFGEEPRAAIEWLLASIDARSPLRAPLAPIAARLRQTDRAYHLHELLSVEHHAEHVTTFLDEARAAGLAYLGDAIPSDVAIELAADSIASRADALVGPHPAPAQQLLDFARDAAFRRALLVRADVAEARGWTWPSRLDASAIASLVVARREDVHVEGHVEVGDPRELLDLYLAGAIDLHAYRAPFVRAPSARPVACPLARWRASNGGPITNRLHHEVALADSVQRALLARLDGTRDAATLARDLASNADGVSTSDARRVIDAAVDAFARAALLVA